MPPPEESSPRTRAPCSFAWFTFGPHSGRSRESRQPRTLIRVLKMAPMLWEPSSRLPASGSMDSADTFRPWETRCRRHRNRQGHVSHDYRARRAATRLLRTSTVSVASSYHSGTALPGLAKAHASRLPRPPLLPAESLPRVLPRPPMRNPTPLATHSPLRLRLVLPLAQRLIGENHNLGHRSWRLLHDYTL